MFSVTSPSLFVFAVLLLLFTPGPTNTLLWSSGAVLGVRRSVPLQLGELLGYLLAISLILLVVEPVLQRIPALQSVLAFAVGLYIYVLAYRIWLRPTDGCEPVAAVDAKKVFIVTLLNPKAFVFALTIIPVGHALMHWYCVALAACILAAGFCWIVVGHLLGSAVGRDNLMLFNRGSSVILGGFASYLVLTALS